VSAEGWQLFAAVLKAVPDSTLLINLKNLGPPATAFISEEFEEAEISRDRLRFVHAENSEALCRLWLEADLGLAPPVDAGELALPTGLWMGRPYLALRSSLPWSRRPAAWLEATGAGQWIAETPADYVALARQFMANRPAAADPALRAKLKELKLNDPAAFAQGFADALRRLMHIQEEQA
jgi:predicted O-linked N-acetylglucosamine transferase (SPINDLY family)